MAMSVNPGFLPAGTWSNAGSALTVVPDRVVVRAKVFRKVVQVVDTAGRALRQAAVDRLAVLDQYGDLTSEHVRLTAQTLGVAERTVWRWVAARRAATPMAHERERFRLDEQLRIRLAYWRGNASALHRELRARERSGGPSAPSLSTLHLSSIDRALRHRQNLGPRRAYTPTLGTWRRSGSVKCRFERGSRGVC
ncbi:hypothetical protein [Nocardia yunnanensis]|uniref:hypothetical protein n=1 Tax=Nocardia yunnanensis TaxID=2382165 RepID=UPI001FE70EB0|nr:hypothetical protein [Nocardia yunnanensis]